MRLATANACLLCLAILAGCGGGSAFGPTYPDNRNEAIAAVVARLHAEPAPQEAPLAAGLTSAPERLFVVDLQSGNKLWEQNVTAPVSAPIIAGAFVVQHEQAGIVVRDAASGQTRFTIEDQGLPLVGAAGAANGVVLTLSTGGGVGAQSRLIYGDASGVVWERPLTVALGAPAFAAGMLFVPWATQNLSVIDAEDNAEIARVRITDTTVGRAWRFGSDIYFGQRGVFRFDESVASGATESSQYLEPFQRTLPGEPAFAIDPYRPAPPPTSAVHRIRLSWRASGASDGNVALSGDALYSGFYRMIFALAPEEEAVRWAYQHDEDIVGLAASPGGVFLADMNGGFAFVDDHGNRRWETRLPMTPTVVEFRAGTFAPPGAAGPANSVHDQLLAAAQNTDARMVPGRVLAVHMLHALADDDVTAHLITLCEDQRSPVPVREEACTALGSRSSGPSPILEALRRRPSYLRSEAAPPVAALARAAQGMELRQAAGDLIAHLHHPGTPEEALPAIAQALRSLQTPESIAALSEFLHLYHAEDAGEALTETLAIAAKALGDANGAEAVPVLEDLIADTLALGRVRGRLRDVLEPIQQRLAEEAAQAAANPETEGAVETAEGTTVEGADADPETETEPAVTSHITSAQVEHALADVMDELQSCLRADPRHPRSSRVVLVLDGQGSMMAANVSPHHLQACIEPVLRRKRFPRNTRLAREQVILNIRR